MASQARRVKEPHRNILVQSAIVEDIQKRINACAVFFLTDHFNDLLMWSHYADRHRGLCLQFRMLRALLPPSHPPARRLPLPAARASRPLAAR